MQACMYTDTHTHTIYIYIYTHTHTHTHRVKDKLKGTLSKGKVKVKVAQLCLTLCDPMDFTVHGILQARILEWVAFPFSKGISPTQGSNPGLLHCRQILYYLSHKGSLSRGDDAEVEYNS